MIRLAVAELAHLADVQALAAAFHGENGNPIDAAAEADALLFSLQDSSRSCFLVEFGMRTVGYAVIVYANDAANSTASIEELFIVPDARGFGLAREVVDALARRLAAHSAAALAVDVDHADIAAVYFYGGFGFAFAEPGVMAKALGPPPGSG